MQRGTAFPEIHLLLHAAFARGCDRRRAVIRRIPERIYLGGRKYSYTPARFATADRVEFPAHLNALALARAGLR